MRVNRPLFRSQLGQRVFLAFVVCALLPIGVLGVVSYRSVGSQLVEQASERLRQQSKAVGLSLFERLLFAETEMIAATEDLVDEPDAGHPVDLDRRVGRFEIIDVDAQRLLLADSEDNLEFERRRLEDHLARGRAVLMPRRDALPLEPVRLARRLRPDQPDSPLVVAEVDPRYLWGLDTGNSIAATAEFCVFDTAGRAVYQSFDGCRRAREGLSPSATPDVVASGPKLFVGDSTGGEAYVAGHRDLFLGGRFFGGSWRIVVCEPRSTVIAPIRRWRSVFPAVMLLASCVALLFVIGAIRRNLRPVDQLRDATIDLADRNFDVKVEITTGDELEELGDAFNEMASRLRRQFAALDATGKIHRAILSSLETDHVVEATVVGLFEYFSCDRAVVVVFDTEERGGSRSSAASESLTLDEAADLGLDAELRDAIRSAPGGTVFGHDVPTPGALVSMLGFEDMAMVVAVPVTLRGRAAAVMGLGCVQPCELDEDDLGHLTKIGDQFAVALSNSRMVAEIDDFSYGTLEALARAVDAKSPWTAGHSERVTRLSVIIGDAYGLDPFEISKLYRGAMLHDIGKLGISQILLDKRGRLDDNEYSAVRSHTMIGERILEPISAFTDIMSVVTQHHERFDGSGYPNGLEGEQIDIKARILAVADVYDAMTNPRPYRAAVDPGDVIKMIREQAGTEFDPTVVEAFLHVIETRGGIEGLAILKRDFSFFPRQIIDAGWRSASHVKGTLS